MGENLFKALKQLVHNDLGLGKKHIEQMVRDAVSNMTADALQRFIPTWGFRQMVQRCVSDHLRREGLKITNPQEEGAKVTFAWMTGEGEVTVAVPHDALHASLCHNGPPDVIACEGGRTITNEVMELDMQNLGSSILAEKLLEIARQGRPHGGAFGGEKEEAVAQAILALRARVAELDARQANEQALGVAGCARVFMGILRTGEKAGTFADPEVEAAACELLEMKRRLDDFAERARERISDDE